jgi:prepilin-type N-terminal cleavage/methylation domain-containing protein
MYINRTARTRVGWTLVEMMVALALFSIASAGLATLYTFTSRSFAALGDYAQLSKANRQAMDILTREIRQAKQVNSCSTNPPSITITRGDGLSVTYSFNSDRQQLVRTVSDGTRQVLLSNCSLISFNLCQRNPIGGTYNIYPAAVDNWQRTVKVIQLTWKTSAKISNRTVSENVQTARIVIRKQDNGV